MTKPLGKPSTAKPPVGKPDVEIVPDNGEWKADPDVLRVRRGSRPFILIAGPDEPRLEGVWFKDMEHSWMFGAKSYPAFPPDASGSVKLWLEDVDVGEYRYSFRIGGKTFDPKIIIEPPTPPN